MIWVVISVVLILMFGIVIVRQANDLHAKSGEITRLKSQQVRNQESISSLVRDVDRLMTQKLDLERFKKRVESAGQPIWEDN